MSNNLPHAIEVLVAALRGSEDYRNAWKANIAMAFYDACHQSGIVFPELREVSNKAADQFLYNLCRDGENK
jgi:hypothetical protein